MVDSVVHGLFNDEYAPITSSIGFLRLPIDRAAAALVAWRRSLYGRVDVAEVPERFPECLRRLEPLVAGARPREMLVGTRGPWTAYFDCSLLGTDAFPVVTYLVNMTGAYGLTVGLRPDTIRPDGAGQYGSLRFSMYRKRDDDPLATDSIVAAVNDGGTWTFDLYGEPREFEETDAYRRRHIRDRFTPDMLIRYCEAIGIDLPNRASTAVRRSVSIHG